MTSLEKSSSGLDSNQKGGGLRERTSGTVWAVVEGVCKESVFSSDVVAPVAESLMLAVVVSGVVGEHQEVQAAEIWLGA